MVIFSFRLNFSLQGWQENLPMSDYFWLREAQFERIKPYFPLSHGVPRVDDRRVVSGIIHVIRNGLPVAEDTHARAAASH
jgi:transposase